MGNLCCFFIVARADLEPHFGYPFEARFESMVSTHAHLEVRVWNQARFELSNSEHARFVCHLHPGLAPPPWALASLAVVGTPGPLWAFLGICGPGPCRTPWALAGLAFVSPAGPLWAGPWWGPLGPYGAAPCGSPQAQGPDAQANAVSPGLGWPGVAWPGK